MSILKQSSYGFKQNVDVHTNVDVDVNTSFPIFECPILGKVKGMMVCFDSHHYLYENHAQELKAWILDVPYACKWKL